jgi:hypothetical protein
MKSTGTGVGMTSKQVAILRNHFTLGLRHSVLAGCRRHLKSCKVPWPAKTRSPAEWCEIRWVRILPDDIFQAPAQDRTPSRRIKRVPASELSGELAPRDLPEFMMREKKNSGGWQWVPFGRWNRLVLRLGNSARCFGGFLRGRTGIGR